MDPLLSNYLPPKIAQRLLGSILSDSMALLSVRKVITYYRKQDPAAHKMRLLLICTIF